MVPPNAGSASLFIDAWPAPLGGRCHRDRWGGVRPGGSTSTRDDVRIFREYVERHDVRRVIAVTSMYHTRRARWALRRALDGLSVDIMMAPAPELHFSEDDWWRSEAGTIAYFQEYVKWVHNYLNW